MGVFDESWVKPVEKQLGEIYASYQRLAAAAQKSRFTIHPIRYDHVLSSLVSQWETSDRDTPKP